MNEATTTITRKERKAATRLNLKSAARQCFIEHGFEGTQISHITKAAGVAQGTFYVHFPDKEHVLDELLGEFNSKFVERLVQAWRMLEPPTLRNIVESSVDTFLDFWEEHRELVLVLSQRASQGVTMERLRDGANPETLGFLLTRFAPLLPRLSTSPVTLRMIVLGILSLWLRLGMQFLFSADVSRDSTRTLLVQMTLGAISGIAPTIGLDENVGPTN